MKVRLKLRAKLKPANPTIAAKVRTAPRPLLKAEKSINDHLARHKQNGTKLTISVKRPLDTSDQFDLQTNSAGNNRGLHMRENPPSQEHMRKIRSMRKIYNKQIPAPQCNSCAFSANCPQFKAGYECAFKPFLQAHKVESLTDLKEYMRDIVTSNQQRLQLASIFERMSGGMPSSELSEMYAMQFQQMRDLFELEKGSGADVTLETSDEGIIAQLFGGMGSLLQDTIKQSKDIQGDLLDIQVEENNDDHRKALTAAGKSGGNVNRELVAEVERSREHDAESAPVARPKRSAKVDNILQVSSLSVS